MHILPGLLTLALFSAPPARCAPDDWLARLAGHWEGTVSGFPSDCVWEVKARVSDTEEPVTGSYGTSGGCSDANLSGTFTGVPSGGGCFSISIGSPGLPKAPFKACFTTKGVLRLTSSVMKGSLWLNSRGTRAGLDTRSPTGKLTGKFHKILKGAARKSGRKGRADGPAAEKEAPEVLIGSY